MYCIVVMGIPGSGKMTTANELAGRFQIPV